MSLDKATEKTCAVGIKDEPYVLVRADRSGVFVGKLISHNQREVLLNDCRRLWRWYGARTCSELAIDGTDHVDCKFSSVTQDHIILDAIEIIKMSDEAVKKIYSVEPWRI